MIVARSQYDERPVFASDLDFKDDPGVQSNLILKMLISICFSSVMKRLGNCPI